MITVDIQDYDITVTAAKLEFDVIRTEGDKAEMFYRLIKADGGIAEEGNKKIPIEALGYLGQNPLSMENLNTVLASWGITATGLTE